MALFEKQLLIKKSGIPGSGKGLFTITDIPSGTQIVEYKGKVTDWKDVNHKDGKNPYIFYVNRKRVIDALNYPSALARYANDASGITRTAGLRNNSIYETRKGKVYIKAVKNIKKGTEILVAYGKEYWEVIKALKKETG